MRRPWGAPAKCLWIAVLVCSGSFVGYAVNPGICSGAMQTVGSMYSFEPGSLDTFLLLLTAEASMYGLLFGTSHTVGPKIDGFMLAGSAAIGSRIRMLGNQWRSMAAGTSCWYTLDPQLEKFAAQAVATLVHLGLVQLFGWYAWSHQHRARRWLQIRHDLLIDATFGQRWRKVLLPFFMMLLELLNTIVNTVARKRRFRGVVGFLPWAQSLLMAWILSAVHARALRHRQVPMDLSRSTRLLRFVFAFAYMRSVQACFAIIPNDVERLLLCVRPVGFISSAVATDLFTWVISASYACWLLFAQHCSPLEVVSCWTVIAYCVRGLEAVASNRNRCYHAVARSMFVLVHMSMVALAHFKFSRRQHSTTLTCDACGAHKRRRELRFCACMGPIYCGPACQKAHWKREHRHYCPSRPWDRIRHERPLSSSETAMLLLLIAGGIFFYSTAPHGPQFLA